MPRRRLAAPVTALVLLLGVAGACSDDDGGDDTSTADGSGSTTSITVVDDTIGPGGTDDPATGAGDPANGDPGTGTGDDPDTGATGTTGPNGEPATEEERLVEGACTLLPPGTEIPGLGALPPGVSGGDDRRQVCTITAGDTGGVGLTLGREAGDRFDDKVAASQNALGVDGEDVGDLGERARFFYSDASIPEGVGGVVVLAGGTTIDITLQGMTQDEVRAAALAIATVVVGNL